MRVVEIKLVPSRDGAEERFTLSIYAKRNNDWVEKYSFDAMAGGEEGHRKLFFEDGERLVIDSQADHTIVLDKEQMAAVPAPIDESAKKRKEEFDEEQKKLHDKHRGVDEKAAKEKAPAEFVMTNLGNRAEDQPTRPKSQPKPEAKEETKHDSKHEERSGSAAQSPAAPKGR